MDSPGWTSAERRVCRRPQTTTSTRRPPRSRQVVRTIQLDPIGSKTSYLIKLDQSRSNPDVVFQLNRQHLMGSFSKARIRGYLVRQWTLEAGGRNKALMVKVVTITNNDKPWRMMNEQGTYLVCTRKRHMCLLIVIAPSFVKMALCWRKKTPRNLLGRCDARELWRMVLEDLWWFYGWCQRMPKLAFEFGGSSWFIMVPHGSSWVLMVHHGLWMFMDVLDWSSFLPDAIPKAWPWQLGPRSCSFYRCQSIEMGWFNLHLSWLVAACWCSSGEQTLPSKPLWFRQKVSHFSATNASYLQRYYMDDQHWAGPGSPIFVIMGGEGGIPPETGIFYPWVVDVLAKEYHGLVIEPEHRFYGESLPFGNPSFSPDNLKAATCRKLGDQPRYRQKLVTLSLRPWRRRRPWQMPPSLSDRPKGLGIAVLGGPKAIAPCWWSEAHTRAFWPPWCGWDIQQWWIWLMPLRHPWNSMLSRCHSMLTMPRSLNQLKGPWRVVQLRSGKPLTRWWHSSKQPIPAAWQLGEFADFFFPFSWRQDWDGWPFQHRIWQVFLAFGVRLAHQVRLCSSFLSAKQPVPWQTTYCSWPNRLLPTSTWPIILPPRTQVWASWWSFLVAIF